MNKGSTRTNVLLMRVISARTKLSIIQLAVCGPMKMGQIKTQWSQTGEWKPTWKRTIKSQTSEGKSIWLILIFLPTFMPLQNNDLGDGNQNNIDRRDEDVRIVHASKTDDPKKTSVMWIPHGTYNQHRLCLAMNIMVHLHAYMTDGSRNSACKKWRNNKTICR